VPINVAKALISAGWLTAAVLIAAGCGARHEYRADNLTVVREQWDTVQVDVSFVRRSTIGGDVPMRPDSVVISVFDEAYEHLYTGGPGRIPLPDHRLGDRERLIVEACGIVKARQICLQEALLSSPKRLTMQEEILYPAGTDLSSGRFDFTFQAERRVFGSDAWERIEAEGVAGYLLAWVEDPEARDEGRVQIPFSAASGRFDLSRHGNYRNFRYFLDSQILDEASARVNFDIYASLGPTPVHLASVRKEITQKSEGDRVDDVRYFVEQATERLIDELGSFLGGRRAVANVDEWEYDGLARAYRVTMDAEWEGPVFNRREFEIEGVLEVGEDGSQASFRLRSGNRRAIRRWRDRTGDDTLLLGTLGVRQDGRATATF
jgi:hypothetical protein